MATNLFWGYSDIPRKAYLTLMPAADTSHSEAFACIGPRRMFYKAATSIGLHRFIFDLGSSTTRAISYLYIARAKMLWDRDSTINVNLESSSDTVTWTSRISSAPIAAGDKVGPRTDDYLKTTTTTSAFRYWRLSLYNTGGSAILPAFSKAMFGPAFDFGRDPATSRVLQRIVINRGVREPRYKILLTYQGITNAKLQEFQSEILEYMDIGPVVLFTSTTYPEVLNSAKAIHCSIVNCDIDPVNYNNNSLSIELDEEI